MNKIGREFRDFILRGNVVDLAVAVVIGAAFTSVVDATVKHMITPLVAAFGGLPDFSALSFTINSSVFRYGAYVNTVVAFMITAGIIFFFVVKPMNLLAARFKTETPIEKKTRDCPFCLSSVPEKATRCPFCTSELAALNGAAPDMPLPAPGQAMAAGATGD